MYQSHFHLHDRPFSSAANPEHYYPAASIEQARESIARNIERSSSVVIVTGPVGGGKTLLCELIASQYTRELPVCLLHGERLQTPSDLLQSILHRLGLPILGQEEGELRLILNDHISSAGCVNGILLVIDDAERLSRALLDEIRSMTNIVRDGRSRARVLLVGCSRLEENLAQPEMESLNQRIVGRLFLDNFSEQETSGYIEARIAACGGDVQSLFTADALETVFRATHGVPRLVNQICDHALMLGAINDTDHLNSRWIEEAWADLQQLPVPSSDGSFDDEFGEDNVIEFGPLEDAVEANELIEIEQTLTDLGFEAAQAARPVKDGSVLEFESQHDQVPESLGSRAGEAAPLHDGSSEFEATDWETSERTTEVELELSSDTLEAADEAPREEEHGAEQIAPSAAAVPQHKERPEKTPELLTEMNTDASSTAVEVNWEAVIEYSEQSCRDDVAPLDDEPSLEDESSPQETSCSTEESDCEEQRDAELLEGASETATTIVWPDALQSLVAGTADAGSLDGQETVLCEHLQTHTAVASTLDNASLDQLSWTFDDDAVPSTVSAVSDDDAAATTLIEELPFIAKADTISDEVIDVVQTQNDEATTLEQALDVFGDQFSDEEVVVQQFASASSFARNGFDPVTTAYSETIAEQLMVAHPGPRMHSVTESIETEYVSDPQEFQPLSAFLESDSSADDEMVQVDGSDDPVLPPDSHPMANVQMSLAGDEAVDHAEAELDETSCATEWSESSRVAAEAAVADSQTHVVEVIPAVGPVGVPDAMDLPAESAIANADDAVATEPEVDAGNSNRDREPCDDFSERGLRLADTAEEGFDEVNGESELEVADADADERLESPIVATIGVQEAPEDTRPKRRFRTLFSSIMRGRNKRTNLMRRAQ